MSVGDNRDWDEKSREIKVGDIFQIVKLSIKKFNDTCYIKMRRNFSFIMYRFIIYNFAFQINYIFNALT